MQKIAIVILAAGASERMGRPKQFLLYNGRALLRHAAETALASCCQPVIVVLGAYADEIQPEIEGARVEVALNPEWKEGMSGSIRTGLMAVQALPHEVDGVMFMLCDQPLVSAALLDRLVDAFSASGLPIAACVYDGDPGVPALFARSLFPALLALQGAEGAKQILRKHLELVARVPFPEGRIDIDTLEDYQTHLNSPSP